MNKPLIVAGAFFAAVISAVLLTLVFFDADKVLRPRIEKRIAERTAYRISIGHISLHFALTPWITLENVSGASAANKKGLSWESARVTFALSYGDLIDVARGEEIHISGSVVRAEDVLLRWREADGSSTVLLEHLVAEMTDARADNVELSVWGPSGPSGGEVKVQILKDQGAIQVIGRDLVLETWSAGKGETLKGLANLDLNLVPPRDSTAGLTGKGTFEAEDGSWILLDTIKSLKARLAGIPGAVEKLKTLPSTTEFKKLRMDFEIRDEAVFLKKGSLQSAGGNVTVLFQGRAGFDQRLSLEGELFFPFEDVPKRIRAIDGRAQLPLKIGGTIREPKPDWDPALDKIMSALLSDDNKRALQKGLKNLLDKAPDDVKNLLKGIKF